ncbi:hypothetical protein B1R94_02955 [Mycolicibacterium litorale]|nr:hypothetical protein B1R94_02955 [Mycolicibacterium litorale]
MPRRLVHIRESANGNPPGPRRNSSAAGVQYAPAFGDEVVAYGLEMVAVVSVVVVDGSGGTSSTALSGGAGGGSLVGLRSAGETDVETDGETSVEIGAVVVGVVRVVVDVTVAVGATGTGACLRELCAVCITASTKITSSSTAATPET